jgi:hypothetical protein
MTKRYTSETTGWASVVAYDPGGTTGWAVMSALPRDLIRSNKSTPAIIQHYASGEITGVGPEQADQLAELVDAWPDCAVVGERFNLRKMAVELQPVKLNSCMEWHLYGSGRPLFEQTPEMAKSKWTDDRLKRAKTGGVSWWVVGKDHARDGTRHAALFMDRVRQQPELRGRAWPHLFNLKGELK